MKKLSLFGTTALVAMALASGVPAMAASPSSAQKNVMVPPSSSYYLKQIKEAGQMMGQVELARRALDLGLNEEAADHIAKARQLAGTIEGKSPELSVVSTLRAGGKVYTFNNDYKDYLIPVVDDLFTANDYDIAVKSKRKDEAVEADAEVGRYQLALDIRNVEKALDKAGADARDGKIIEARTALNDMFKGSVETAMAYEDPIWAVHDNLMAAHTMILDKDFTGAKFALKRAQAELKTIEKSGAYATDSATVERLGQEVATLHNSLRIEDPNIIGKAEKEISGWLKDLRRIGHKEMHG